MMQGIMSKLDQLRQGSNMGGGSPMPQQAPSLPLPPQEAMMPAGLMQDAAPEMVAEAPNVDPNQEVQMLADAVIKRSGGDPQTALDILEGAKGVVIQSIQGSQRPRMMERGGPLAPQTGSKVAEEEEEGRTLSDRDLKPIPKGKEGAGLRKLSTKVREKMGYMAMGGDVQSALNRLNYLRDN